MRKQEDRTHIKKRMLQAAAREWGLRNATEIDLQAFDPMVDLLMGACAFEFEKVGREIDASRNRIFERLVEVLTPNGLIEAKPAHAVLHACPVEPMAHSQPEDLCFYKHPSLGRDLFFSPTEKYPLFNGQLAWIAHGRQLCQIQNYVDKQVVAETIFGKNLPLDTFYLGIELHREITHLNGLRIFFDWKNHPSIKHYLRGLANSQWSIGDKILKTHQGISTPNLQLGATMDFSHSTAEHEFVENINALYEAQFVSLAFSDFNANKHLEIYPNDFKDCFEVTYLQKLSKPLLWLKVQMPYGCQEGFDGMECLLNGIPVVNRNLVEKQEKLQEYANVFALNKTQQHFLSIIEVSGDNGIPYATLPFHNMESTEGGVYAIRKGGVTRYDRKDVHNNLSALLDMARDESAAFHALGYNNLTTDLQELKQIFTRIHKNTQKQDLQGQINFLFVQPTENDKNIHIKYWVMDGDLANNIPVRTPLRLFSSTNLQANSLFLATSTRGGKASLQGVDSINAFREAIMTQGTIVTKEDIKAFCLSRLDTQQIHQVEVKTGIIKDSAKNKGLVRCIEVRITPKMGHTTGALNWQNTLRDLETILNKKSASIHPIKVILLDD